MYLLMLNTLFFFPLSFCRYALRSQYTAEICNATDKISLENQPAKREDLYHYEIMADLC